MDGGAVGIQQAQSDCFGQGISAVFFFLNDFELHYSDVTSASTASVSCFTIQFV
jgi:hypothetical protein